MTDLVPIDHDLDTRPAKTAYLDLPMEAQVQMVSKMATVLTDIIEKQRLYSNIQGKKYVKVEGWVLLGNFLGVLPKEKEVKELPDGSYEAIVELVRSDSGRVVGAGSALCSVDEKRWGGAEKYARRSMAITRATGKAYRIAFPWVINMAGYETTPAEEMPTIEVKAKEDDTFQPTKEAQEKLRQYLISQSVPADAHDGIIQRMVGRKKSDIKAVISEELQ